MGEKQDVGSKEWPWTPPLEPGKGEELRDVARPGNDVVFEANDDKRRGGEAKKRSRTNPKSANDDTARTDDARTDDDATHSRTER